MSRPSEFTPEIGKTICVRLMNGESLRSICAEDDMPARSTVHLWLIDHREFSDQYARAREVQGHNYADDTIDIADDGTNDWMTRRRENGTIETVVDHEHIARSKLRIDARKWMASKLTPKKYGERSTVEHEGTVNHDHRSPGEARDVIEGFLSRKKGEQDPATKH